MTAGGSVFEQSDSTIAPGVEAGTHLVLVLVLQGDGRIHVGNKGHGAPIGDTDMQGRLVVADLLRLRAVQDRGQSRFSFEPAHVELADQAPTIGPYLHVDVGYGGV